MEVPPEVETVLEEEIRNDVLMLIIFPIPKNPSLASVSLLNNFLSRDLFLKVWSTMLYEQSVSVISVRLNYPRG